MGSSTYVINFIVLASCQLSISPGFLLSVLTSKTHEVINENGHELFFLHTTVMEQLTLLKAFI